MKEIITKILDWSEVWAILIPLTVYVVNRKEKKKWERPLLIYLIITLINNLVIDFIFHPYLEYKVLQSNHIFYNLNSVVRFFCFISFFQYTYSAFEKLIPVTRVVFLIIVYFSYTVLNNAYDFNSKMMALESAILLVFCIIWFYLKIRDTNSGGYFSENSSWAVTGIFFYSAINFFVFLFYETLIKSDNNFAFYIWDVHNISFIIMCILFSFAFRKK